MRNYVYPCVLLHFQQNIHRILSTKSENRGDDVCLLPLLRMQSNGFIVVCCILIQFIDFTITSSRSAMEVCRIKCGIYKSVPLPGSYRVFIMHICVWQHRRPCIWSGAGCYYESNGIRSISTQAVKYIILFCLRVMQLPFIVDVWTRVIPDN